MLSKVPACPGITVTVNGPEAGILRRLETILIQATVDFPDHSQYPDSNVYALLHRPDRTSTQIALTNTGNNLWSGSYTLPQAGHYSLWVRVDPPIETGFIDGNGWSKWDALWEGGVVLQPGLLQSPYPLYGRIPLNFVQLIMVSN